MNFQLVASLPLDDRIETIITICYILRCYFRFFNIHFFWFDLKFSSFSIYLFCFVRFCVYPKSPRAADVMLLYMKYHHRVECCNHKTSARIVVVTFAFYFVASLVLSNQLFVCFGCCCCC